MTLFAFSLNPNNSFALYKLTASFTRHRICYGCIFIRTRTSSSTELVNRFWYSKCVCFTVIVLFTKWLNTFRKNQYTSPKPYRNFHSYKLHPYCSYHFLHICMLLKCHHKFLLSRYMFLQHRDQLKINIEITSCRICACFRNKIILHAKLFGK